VVKFQATTPTASPCFARSVYRHGCSFFAARQRTNQESAPKAAMFAPVRSTMFAFSEQANLHFRLAERGRLWKPPLCRSTKRKTRDHIKAFGAVPQFLPVRAAGTGSKNFGQTAPILGVRSCAQDGGGLQRQKPRRLLKSRRAVGSQGVSPWFPSWLLLGECQEVAD